MPNENPTMQSNWILASLPPDELARLAGDLELVRFPAGTTLYKPGDNPLFAYFPTSCVVSMICTTEDGATSAVAMTGRDGMLGVPLVLGCDTFNYKVVVQSEGEAYRLRAEVLCWELELGESLHRLALSYIQALLAQIAQNVLCNRYHSVEQQLCRWQLFNLDLMTGNQLNATQEAISNLLGVRREGVTEAARRLQAAELIRYRRGHITVIDRAGLEARVCECYRVIKTEYEQLFANMPIRHRPRRNPAILRQRTTLRLSQNPTLLPPVQQASPGEMAQLVHELQLQQVALEMDNEALRQAYEDADAQREKYADIYDFAPIAYFSLDAEGVILQANLAGAILLGIKRSEMERLRFADSIKPAHLQQFTRFYEALRGGKSRQSCEVNLLATNHRPEVIVKIDAIADDSGTEFRMVVADISEQVRKARA